MKKFATQQRTKERRSREGEGETENIGIAIAPRRPFAREREKKKEDERGALLGVPPSKDTRTQGAGLGISARG